ncbi:MAG: glucosamine-6-phosphate deaminase [Bacteroidales bacterium]|nr:glucosamine-6-phosphate deaminase [Bacteroidales bacterium]
MKKLASKNPLFSGIQYSQPENLAHLDVLSKYEKIATDIYQESKDASVQIAAEIAAKIKERQREGRNCVLGLITGSTPQGVYQELIRMHRHDALSFRNVIVFCTEEFYPIASDSPNSTFVKINQHFISHIDVRPEHVHIPCGECAIDDVYQMCREYDRKIQEYGGIDILLLGIGRSGHIAFNEPGSAVNSRTRLIVLDTATRQDAAAKFGDLINVPTRAITMGLDNIMKAHRVILLGFGEDKAQIIRKTVEEPITDHVPASILQRHPAASVYIDMGAAMQLTRIKTPWLVDSCDWTSEKIVRKAVVWLCQQTGKSILKLTNNDYFSNGLSELVACHKSAYDINIKVFNALQHTITGWPGGKPNADDTNRPERKAPGKKRVIVFSPHPDDDVISMGGTLIRLVDQQHEVHVAYQVSGNIAVSDEYASRFITFNNSYTEWYDPDNERHRQQFLKTTQFLRDKHEGESDTPDMLKIKSLIRRMEARAACLHAGVNPDNVHFLDLPFYETGEVRKKPLSAADVVIVRDFIRTIKPHQIFAAGDLSDPHGTHRVCLDAIFYALEEVKDDDWMRNCWFWLYRGAWHEWDVEDIEMAVPISPDELLKKREAIFRHGSQKEGAMYLGDDSREFWQRAEDRNHATATLYNRLGMAEYEAMEAFVRYYP